MNGCFGCRSPGIMFSLWSHKESRHLGFCSTKCLQGFDFAEMIGKPTAQTKVVSLERSSTTAADILETTAELIRGKKVGSFRVEWDGGDDVVMNFARHPKNQA